MNVIDFPGLGLHFKIDPVAVHLPLPSGGIMWYALIIVSGILLAYIVGSREYERLGGKKDDLMNILLYSVFFSIICARAYYVIFSLDSYHSFADTLKIWEGGLAIYGAVIGTAAVILIYCKRHKLDTLMHFDVAAYGFMLGQAVGRWGNFVNGEAYGSPTNLPWRMVVNGTVAHPTFLYESLWSILGFIIIWNLRKRNSFNGKSLCLYMIWYGTGRAFIELLRTDSLMLGGIRVSSLLSVIFVLSGICLYIRLNKRNIKILWHFFSDIDVIYILML